MADKNCKVRLSWRSLSYSATSGFLTKKTTRILNNLSGSVSSGEVIGLMGSSGSGKSVLLQCLAGFRVTGVTGDISMSSRNNTRLRVSSVPQTAEVYGNLTVRESVLFSSQIRNQDRSKHEHVARVNDLLSSLKLLPAADTTVSRCSGGQQKRVTLAIEMISDPDIMLLDEVTSGLDSRICYDLLALVKEIAASRNIAVLISIHQPTWPSFLMFDRAFMLSHGRCFFYDEPTAIESFLTSIDVPISSEQNPADILMEASCGCFGNDVFANGMSLTSGSIADMSVVTVDEVKMFQVKKSTKSHNNLMTFYILFLRMFLVFIRNVPLATMMILSFSMSVPIAYLVFEDSGSADPCPTVMDVTKNTSFVTIITDQINKSNDIMTNLQAFGSFSNAGSVLGATLLLITIPKLMKLSQMELANNWFHPLILYIVSAAFDAVIFTLTYPIVNAIPFYYWLQQNTEFDRTIHAMSPAITGAFMAQAMVALIASTLSDHIATSISVLLTLTVVFLASSPIMVMFANLPKAQFVYSFFSHQRHALDMVIISQYGDDLCGDQSDLMANAQDTRNYVMNFVQTIRAQVMEVIRKSDQANGNYRFSSLSRSSHAAVDESSINSITETISNTLISPYMSRSGRIESLPFVYGDYEDDDYWKAMGYLITMMIATRIIAGIVFVRKSQTKR